MQAVKLLRKHGLVVADACSGGNFGHNNTHGSLIRRVLSL